MVIFCTKSWKDFLHFKLSQELLYRQTRVILAHYWSAYCYGRPYVADIFTVCIWALVAHSDGHYMCTSIWFEFSHRLLHVEVNMCQLYENACQQQDVWYHIWLLLQFHECFILLNFIRMLWLHYYYHYSQKEISKLSCLNSSDIVSITEFL